MDHQRLLNVLADKYKLRPNLVSVLSALIGGEKMSYIELSRKAGVPKTKVYEIVGELRQMALIDVSQGAKGASLFYMEDVRGNLINFLNKQMDQNLQKYEETLDAIDDDIEEKSIVQTPSEYVFGAIRVISGADDIFILKRRMSVPGIFYPYEKEAYYKLRKAVSAARQTLTGERELTRIMFEETIKATRQKKRLTYIMTKQGLDFFLGKYADCFGKKQMKDFVLGLPELIAQNNCRVFVIDESNPLSLYTSEKRMILVITESKGEMAGIQTNKKGIVDAYLQLFREMLTRSTPIDHYLDRLVN